MEAEGWIPDNPTHTLLGQQAQAQSVMKDLQIQLLAFDSLRKKAQGNACPGCQRQSPICYPKTTMSADKARHFENLSNLLVKMNQSLSDSDHLESSLHACKISSDAVLTWHNVLQKNVDGLLKVNMMESSGMPSGVSSPAASMLRSVYSSSPTKGCLDMSTEKADCNDELWKILDSISDAGERLKNELEKSHKRELDLAEELQMLWNNVQAYPGGILSLVKDPFESRSPSPGRLVMKGSLKKEEARVSRVWELETQVQRLQNAMLSQEEENLDLHRPLISEGAPERNDIVAQALLATFQRENKRLKETVDKLEKEKEHEASRFRRLPSKEEFSTNTATCMSNLANEIRDLKEELEVKEKQISELDRNMQEKIQFLKERHREEVQSLKEQLQLNDSARQQIIKLLNGKDMEIKEERNKLRSRELEVQSLMEMLAQEKSTNQETVANLEKACNSAKVTLSQSENENRALVKELKHLLHKYVSVKKQARSAEEQIRQTLIEKQDIIKLVDSANEEKQRMYNERSLLKKEKEVTLHNLGTLKEEMRHLKQDRYRNVEEKQRLEEKVASMEDVILALKQKLQDANSETQKAMESLSIKDSETEACMDRMQELKQENTSLKMKTEEYIAGKEAMSFQMEVLKKDKDTIQEGLQEHIKQLLFDQQAMERTSEDLRKECSALSRMVADLKEDKRQLQGELKELLQEKRYLEDKSRKLCAEGEKVRCSLTMLEKERDFLQMELSERRKDYLNLSDRIALRLNEICEDSYTQEDHMSIQKLKLSGNQSSTSINQQ
ncbi:coiled-coil domain-containing protein 110 [Polyodon spathula]|uniref:coiled-coil domain-containing protein 110 n=1 Tax=Polyodon spathula TaxID=7913 RepID=UPI001B7E2E69|nr:coiled-coil domain-containing protein 110 [Polyodon spathula]XP_041123608.1 coiled-coil domain-containing protein 110 [Polyodon spathula]